MATEKMRQNGDSQNILLVSERLYLRRVEKSDLELFKRLFCDPRMMQFLGGAWTADLATETLSEWHNEWGRNHYYYGVLIQKSASEAIGIAGFTENTIPEEPGLEFSWFIVPEQQQKGYATEITQEILAYAFDVMGIDRVLAETHPDNIAAARALEKSLFTNIGERANKYDYLPGFEKQELWEYRRANWKGKRTK